MCTCYPLLCVFNWVFVALVSAVFFFFLLFVLVYTVRRCLWYMFLFMKPWSEWNIGAAHKHDNSEMSAGVTPAQLSFSSSLSDLSLSRGDRDTDGYLWKPFHVSILSQSYICFRFSRFNFIFFVYLSEFCPSHTFATFVFLLHFYLFSWRPLPLVLILSLTLFSFPYFPDLQIWVKNQCLLQHTMPRWWSQQQV